MYDNWRASEASETLSGLFNRESRIYILYIIYIYIVGERAKRARHSQVCSIENRGYIYIIVRANCIVRANFVLITRKVGGA